VIKAPAAAIPATPRAYLTDGTSFIAGRRTSIGPCSISEPSGSFRLNSRVWKLATFRFSTMAVITRSRPDSAWLKTDLVSPLHWKNAEAGAPVLPTCRSAHARKPPIELPIGGVRRQFRARAPLNLRRQRHCRLDGADAVATREHRREAACKVNPLPLIEVAAQLAEAARASARLSRSANFSASRSCMCRSGWLWGCWSTRSSPV
jgi:hypothetical protein